jgi:hypothetical protein
MCVINGILEYFTINPKDMLLETIYEETYEEAMQKIENSSKEQAGENILEST